MQKIVIRKTLASKASSGVQVQFEYSNRYGALIKTTKRNGKKVSTSYNRSYCASPLLVRNIVKSSVK